MLMEKSSHLSENIPSVSKNFPEKISTNDSKKCVRNSKTTHGSAYCTKDLHFTRFVGGMPIFFFLLSVTRLKKNPQVGLPTVVNGAKEFAFLISPLLVITYCVGCRWFSKELLRDKEWFSALWNRWKCREYLSGPRCSFFKRRNSNLSQFIVRGFGLNPKLCDCMVIGSLIAFPWDLTDVSDDITESVSEYPFPLLIKPNQDPIDRS